MSDLSVYIVGECAFCNKGDEDKRHVRKILRDGESEYGCGVGENCIIVKLYKVADEFKGFKDKEGFY